LRRSVRLLPWCLLGVAVVDWLGLRLEVFSHPPVILTVQVCGILLALLANLIMLLRRLAEAEAGRLPAAAELLLIGGVTAGLTGGLLNHLLSLQGYVVLQEGARVQLAGGGELQEFSSGAWARIEDLKVALELQELELLPVGGGRFVPQSRLIVEQAGEPAELVLVGAGAPAAGGVLRFHQGAFGFAPELVVLRDGVSLLERVVPFTTVREGPDGVSFQQDFTVDEGHLTIRAAVDLASLDEGMRGHATLRLSLERDGRRLGSGSLMPGHFADLAEGHRIGFVGLQRWAEIDVSRRHYGGLVLSGAAVAAVGLIAWLACRWRSR